MSHSAIMEPKALSFSGAKRMLHILGVFIHFKIMWVSLNRVVAITALGIWLMSFGAIAYAGYEQYSNAEIERHVEVHDSEWKELTGPHGKLDEIIENENNRWKEFYDERDKSREKNDIWKKEIGDKVYQLWYGIGAVMALLGINVIKPGVLFNRKTQNPAPYYRPEKTLQERQQEDLYAQWFEELKEDRKRKLSKLE